MTQLDHAALRKAVEAATQIKFDAPLRVVSARFDAFRSAFSPPVALALLDEVAALRAAIATVPEWDDYGAEERYDQCFFCKNMRQDGHAADCVRKESA